MKQTILISIICLLSATTDHKLSKTQIWALKPSCNLNCEIRKAAKRHKLNPDVFSAVLWVESRHTLSAINKKSQDYGIGQLNSRIIAHYGLSKHKLTTNLKYSLSAAAAHLAWFKRKYPKDYICRYNVGTGKLVGALMERCILYSNKVSKANLYLSSKTSGPKRLVAQEEL